MPAREKSKKLLKTSGADILSSRKKIEGSKEPQPPPSPPPPHLYVRGLKQNTFVSLRPNEEICFIDAQKDKTGNKHDGVLK